MGGRGAAPVGEKAKDFKGGGKRLWAHLKPHRAPLIIVMIFAALSTVFSIAGPKVLSMATDEIANGFIRMVTGAGEGINFTKIGEVLLILTVMYFVGAAFMYLQGFIMSGITTKISYNLRNSIEEKINKLPLTYFHGTSTGDVLSRITNDVDTLNTSLSQSITQLITSVCTIIGVLIMMLTISWQMTLVAVLIIPVSIVFVFFIVRASQKYFMGQQMFLGRVNGQVEEMYGGHLVTKAFGREQEAVDNFDEENKKLYDSGWKSQFLSSVMHPVMNFVANLGYVVICIVGAYMASVGMITLGGIQAFIQYVKSFTQPITQMASVSSQLQSTVAASERIFQFLDAEEELVENPIRKMSDIAIKGDIRFEKVRFAYDKDADEMVINDFSATVKAGQTVAIVGPTGAGKTTMVKLLMRFYELNGGKIYIDGYDYTEFSKEDVRGIFGMVLQETWLYSDTIMENIRYGRLGATDEEVIAAAKAAQADRFIRTLPGGYQMELNEEGSNVSQGQKQLLTIARAMLADSKITILDEATSSVDTRTETLIQKAFQRMMDGRTSFVIAHRLSTIRNADLILCMDKGDIVEQGTHDELMATGGFYADLYNSQFDNAEEATAI